MSSLCAYLKPTSDNYISENLIITCSLTNDGDGEYTVFALQSLIRHQVSQLPSLVKVIDIHRRQRDAKFFIDYYFGYHQLFVIVKKGQNRDMHIFNVNSLIALPDQNYFLDKLKISFRQYSHVNDISKFKDTKTPERGLFYQISKPVSNLQIKVQSQLVEKPFGFIQMSSPADVQIDVMKMSNAIKKNSELKIAKEQFIDFFKNPPILKPVCCQFGPDKQCQIEFNKSPEFFLNEFGYYCWRLSEVPLFPFAKISQKGKQSTILTFDLKICLHAVIDMTASNGISIGTRSEICQSFHDNRKNFPQNRYLPVLRAALDILGPLCKSPEASQEPHSMYFFGGKFDDEIFYDKVFQIPNIDDFLSTYLQVITNDSFDSAEEAQYLTAFDFLNQYTIPPPSTSREMKSSFMGPAKFAPAIKSIISRVEQKKSDRFHVVVFIHTGDIWDMEETLDALSEKSTCNVGYPLAIIFINIGKSQSKQFREFERKAKKHFENSTASVIVFFKRIQYPEECPKQLLDMLYAPDQNPVPVQKEATADCLRVGYVNALAAFSDTLQNLPKFYEQHHP